MFYCLVELCRSTSADGKGPMANNCEMLVRDESVSSRDLRCLAAKQVSMPVWLGCRRWTPGAL
jgi:hypothetical protein